MSGQAVPLLECLCGESHVTFLPKEEGISKFHAQCVLTADSVLC